jgi:hypothetical protein
MVRAGEEWHVTKGSCEVTVTSPKRDCIIRSSRGRTKKKRSDKFKFAMLTLGRANLKKQPSHFDLFGMDAVVRMALYSGKIPSKTTAKQT